MSIQKIIFVYFDSNGNDFYVPKAATGNINLDADANTEEEIEFELLVDSSAETSESGETISWRFKTAAEDPPSYSQDSASGCGFYADRSPGNTSTTPVGGQGGIFPSITINRNDNLVVEDANPQASNPGDSLYGFTVTVVGETATGTPISVRTDPTIRNGGGN